MGLFGLLKGCEVSCLEIFRNQLDDVLGTQVWVFLLEQG